MMLQKDPNLRASLDTISKCDWLTRNGKEIIDIEMTGDHDKNLDKFNYFRRNSLSDF